MSTGQPKPVYSHDVIGGNLETVFEAEFIAYQLVWLNEYL